MSFFRNITRSDLNSAPNKPDLCFGFRNHSSAVSLIMVHLACLAGMQPTNKSGPIYHYALDKVSEYHSFGISQVLHRSIMQNSYRIGLSVHMRAFTYTFVLCC